MFQKISAKSVMGLKILKYRHLAIFKKFHKYSKIITRRYSKNVADIKFMLLFLVKTWLKYRQSDTFPKHFMSFIRWFQLSYGNMKRSKTVWSHAAAPLRFPVVASLLAYVVFFRVRSPRCMVAAWAFKTSRKVHLLWIITALDGVHCVVRLFTFSSLDIGYQDKSVDNDR